MTRLGEGGRSRTEAAFMVGLLKEAPSQPASLEQTSARTRARTRARTPQRIKDLFARDGRKDGLGLRGFVSKPTSRGPRSHRFGTASLSTVAFTLLPRHCGRSQRRHRSVVLEPAVRAVIEL